MAASVPPVVVAVTGAAGYLGQQLLARLEREDGVKHIVAIDIHPVPDTGPKVTSLRQDVTEPLEQTFRRHGVEAVVHLAFVLRQGRDRRANRRVNVGGAASVLQACDAAGVRRIVALSSSTVYGAHADNPIRLDEDAPCRPPRAFHYAWDKADSERLLQGYAEAHPDTVVSILRGCVVMGPSASNFITSSCSSRCWWGYAATIPQCSSCTKTTWWSCSGASWPNLIPASSTWPDPARCGGRSWRGWLESGSSGYLPPWPTHSPSSRGGCSYRTTHPPWG